MSVPVVRSAPAPAAVRAAAMLLVGYGALVVANAALVGQSLGIPLTASIFPRAALRFLGVLLVAFGLLKLARWAWWAAVVLGGLWLLIGVAGLTALGVGGASAEALPAATLWLMPIATLILGVAIGLLVLGPGRAAFAIGAG